MHNINHNVYGLFMLIDFSVENYRSICDWQVLTLEHDRTIKDIEAPIIYSQRDGIPELLRAAVIYGANASGKSTILRALFDMQRLILYGEKKLTYGDKIERITPFLLDKESKNRPTSFEITFTVDNVKYKYRFSATRERITHERLEAYPQNKRQAWFDRTFHEGQYSWKFSPYFKGDNDAVSKATLENVLFFSKAVKENNDMLKPLQLFFKQGLYVMPIDGGWPDFTEELLKEEGGKEKVLNFLRKADLGIDDLVVESKKLSESDFDFPKEVPEEIKRQIREEMVGKEHTITRTVHFNPETQKAELFSLDQESIGTNRLFRMAGLFYKVLDRGAVLVIDELESSLHCRIVGEIIKLFNSSETNPNNAQLIFTTHSSVALADSHLRRDQIWFTDKKQNKTILYPLKRAKAGRVVRKTENLVRSYLSGEYSAVPQIDEQLRFF